MRVDMMRDFARKLACEDQLVDPPDFVEVRRAGGDMGVEEGDAVARCRLFGRSSHEREQCRRVVHHTGLDRRFEAVGESEAADRKRLLSELQQPRKSDRGRSSAVRNARGHAEAHVP